MSNAGAEDESAAASSDEEEEEEGDDEDDEAGSDDEEEVQTICQFALKECVCIKSSPKGPARIEQVPKYSAFQTLLVLNPKKEKVVEHWDHEAGLTVGRCRISPRRALKALSPRP